MKKLLLLVTVLFVQQSCFSVDDADDSLVQKPHEKVLAAVSACDVESLKELQSEYPQTCLVCAQSLNVVQAIPVFFSTSQDKTKIIAQIRELESAQQSGELDQDLESRDSELVRFSVHRECEQQAKKLFLENSKYSKHIVALIGTGLSLGATVCIGIIFFGGMAIQKSCEGEDGMYHCHPC